MESGERESSFTAKCLLHSADTMVKNEKQKSCSGGKLFDSITRFYYLDGIKSCQTHLLKLSVEQEKERKVVKQNNLYAS